MFCNHAWSFNVASFKKRKHSTFPDLPLYRYTTTRELIRLQHTVLPNMFMSIYDYQVTYDGEKLLSASLGPCCRVYRAQDVDE
jgi:hypothetical protein